MKAILAVLMLAMVAACGPRRVKVETGPAPSSEAALHITNNASQAVNVYVMNAGNKIFVGQVAANSTQHLPVSGVSNGTSVSLQATLVDGTKTFSKENVTLTGMTNWQVP
jgi:hypothetical protein